ncbi:MAG: matrixin family metalloprotease [Ignavibacteriaceae bacterium]
MRHYTLNVSIILIAFILSLQPSCFNTAQVHSYNQKPDASNSYHYEYYDNNSNSTLSEASNRYDHSYNNEDFLDKYNRERYSKRKDYYSDNYKRNDYHRKNKKTYNDRNNNNYSNHETRSENYFHIDRSGGTLWDGKHWKISDFPLKIYVKEISSKYYKPGYKKYVKYALDEWRMADDRINYTFVNSDREADISIFFVEDLGKKYHEDYLGLTDYKTNNDNIIEYSKIEISLLKFKKELVSEGEIKATIVHELGHAFGLGHSKNDLDIMYPYINPDHTSDMNYTELSRGDKEAIKDVISLGDKELYVRR